MMPLAALAVTTGLLAPADLTPCERTAFVEIESSEVDQLKGGLSVQSDLPYVVNTIMVKHKTSVVRISYDIVNGDYPKPVNPQFEVYVAKKLGGYHVRRVWAEESSNYCN